MSMKCVGCSNDNLQNGPSEKPSAYPSKYEVCGVRSPSHNLQSGPSQKPSAYPTAAIVCETKHYLVTLHSYDH